MDFFRGLSGLGRKAGQVFGVGVGPTGTGKAAATSSVKEAVTEDKNLIDQVGGVVTGIGGAFVPALGLLDDAVNTVKGLGSIGGATTVGTKGGAVLNTAASATGAATSMGPLATYGPIAPIVGISTAIGVPAAERMTNDSIRKPDIDKYKAMQSWFGHDRNKPRNQV
jgi:hypothetical protein